MPNKPTIDTSGQDWKNWSIRMPISLILGIIFGLWTAFNLYRDMHDLQYGYEEFLKVYRQDKADTERRINTIRDRHDERIKELETNLCK